MNFNFAALDINSGRSTFLLITAKSVERIGAQSHFLLWESLTVDGFHGCFYLEIGNISDYFFVTNDFKLLCMNINLNTVFFILRKLT